ncbi:ATP-dependent DNA helicase RecQ-like [Misgurnus anguillicaudatus]|uniref:ATP-dependent DNA helicase RecQ-like n=1 Tax=Misgurnus anguillicaudatus TaxID=75329 RepID=UPI003CCF76BA
MAAAAGEQLSFEAALAATLEDLNLCFSLREEQITLLKSFLSNKDVFGVLPTGYGKSVIYQLAPLVGKRMGLSHNPLVVVVSPLIALMEDQLKEATKFGLKAKQLCKGDQEDIRSGQCQLVYGSPESWILQKQWRDMLSTKVFQDNILGIVVDEAHLTYKWGKSARGHKAFRESFARLGELRSIVKHGTPIMALTATADLDSRAIIKRQLQLENATQVTISPNRTNIRLGLTTVSSDSMNCLNWVVRKLKENGPRMSPLIIYCRTLTTCGKVFCHLKDELGDDCWVDRDPEHRVVNLLIGMFHSQTLPHHKKRVLASLEGDGACRVVVATTALGMGLNFPNISHVIMYGSPEDVEDIVQEVGRAGRDGSPSHAIIYNVNQHTRLDEGVKTLLKKGTTSCLRKALYSHFEHHTESVVPGHLCCSYCHSVCLCSHGGCDSALPVYELSHDVQVTVKSRKVTEDHQKLIKDLLYRYKLSLVQHTHLYTNSTNCTGFSNELIDCVLERSAEIFDITFIMDNLPVFSKRHGQTILKVFFDIFGDFEYTDVDLPAEDIVVPDQDYTGYFDEDSQPDNLSLCSSFESGFTQLRSSD